MVRTDKLLLASILVLIGFSAWVQSSLGFTGDKYIMLYIAHTWLEGKQLYTEIFEPNMPLITWILAVPVYVSLHVPFLKDYQALALLGVGVTTFSAFLCARLVRFHPEFAGNRTKQLQLVLLLCYVLIFSTNSAYFFDREHIFLVLMLPYMLRWLPSLSHAAMPKHLRVIAGCMAGIGFCMKPHTFIVFLGLQLIYIARERSAAILASLENILIYTIGVLYLFAVYKLNPEYFSTVMPMALLTYHATSNRDGGVIYLFISLLVLGVTFVDFRRRYTSPYRRDIYYFVMNYGFFLAYALANNGWGYTYNLATSVILIATGWVLWEFMYLKRNHESQGLPARQFLHGARACVINLAANGIIIMALSALLLTAECKDYKKCRDEEQFKTILENEHIHSFGTISIAFNKWAAIAEETGLQWDTRFVQLWMLPEFFASDEAFANKHSWVLQYVADAYAEDLERNKPDVMIVDDTDDFYSVHKHVDLIAYLSVFPNFVRAWQHYHYFRVADFCHETAAKYNSSAVCREIIYRRISEKP